ncbi:putative Nucleotide sugar transporter EamA like transporter family UAA transporter family [Trypanosoma vivax]|uniref:Putative UDP-galactose transporter n=1 Tax=Trypanosoma vivax (strain Y486) TaxID=1055687 RepID=G0U4D8_TRYVY|nr:putative UDP-galactose transporter [Trypanosoma vivax]KAH8611821.1 putative Nucleotide sugar transporter EamA like transporter family UAA transporter family [Trypanosoma vivax]CCC52302.1 putative UDP-galactose transporter, fragment [Trypanosoma vivax Y486]
MGITRLFTPASISLGVLVLQNSMLVVLTRYSRVNIPPDKRYFSSTLVLNQEIVKIVVCIIIFAFDNRQSHESNSPGAQSYKSSVSGFLVLLWRSALNDEALKLCLPAFLFTVQNYLTFVGLSNLDAPRFQVWSQTKLLFTAVLSVLMLGRRLTPMQWVSLLVLAFGVLLTQRQDWSVSVATHASNQRPFIGVLACLTSALSSSYATVYFEKITKTTTPSLAVRNIHLSTFSVPFAVASMFVVDVLPSWNNDGKNSSRKQFHFWRGYDQWLTIVLVFIHALGGLLVSAVTKYADNVVKGFATGIAVILSGILSSFIWHMPMSFSFILGSSLITFSTILYDRYKESKPQQDVNLISVTTEEP